MPIHSLIKMGGILYIFDFDNTIIQTTARIKVICSRSKNVIQALTSEEFNTYIKEDDHFLDFKEFECPEILRNEIIHEKIFQSLKKKYDRGEKIAIVSARGSSELIHSFLLDAGINLVREMVIAIHEIGFPHQGSIKERKRKVVENFIKSGSTKIEFIDDSMDNLNEISTLSDIYEIDLKITHVKNGKPKIVRRFQGIKI